MPFVDQETRMIMNDMAETMYSAAGVGLAAPQVGISRRIIVVDVTSGTDKNGLICLANPNILSVEGVEESEEGCLSIPYFSTKISRPSRVAVEGWDMNGDRRVIEADGLLARALQHEIDHINGILIIDRLKGIKKKMVRKKLSKQFADEHR